jgi:hypothetical protein
MIIISLQKLTTMKTFIKVLDNFFLVIEILAGLAVAFGTSFKAMNLAGARELILLGFTTLALIFLLRGITPFYERYVSNSPSMNETLTLFVRRLLYISLMLYALALLFLGNSLNGVDQMMRIGIAAAVVAVVLVIILVALRSERKAVLMGGSIRMMCLLLVHTFLSMIQ